MRAFIGHTVVVLLWLIAVVGWVLNIVNIVRTATSGSEVEITVLFIAQIVGVFFAPLGVILGLVV